MSSKMSCIYLRQVHYFPTSLTLKHTKSIKDPKKDKNSSIISKSLIISETKFHSGGSQDVGFSAHVRQH